LDFELQVEWGRSDVGVKMVAVLDLSVTGPGTGRELNDTDSCPVRSDHDALTLGTDDLFPGGTEHRLGAQLGLELFQMGLDVGIHVETHGCGSSGVLIDWMIGATFNTDAFPTT